MKYLIKAAFFSVWLFGCNSPPDSQQPQPAPLTDSQPKLFIKRGAEQTGLSEINRSPDYTLRLSDKIFFSGLKPLKQKKEHKDSLKNPAKKDDSLKDRSETSTKEAPVLSDVFFMEVFTSCLTGRHKFTAAKQLTDYQTEFYIVDLLPPDILLKAKKISPPVCSILFIVRDRKKNEYLYSLSSLSVLSAEKSSGLKLVNHKNEPAAKQTINLDTMNDFDLILHQGSRFKKIKFLCEETEKDIHFEMESGLTVVSPFKFLQSLPEESLPSGKKKCRILTYDQAGFANAVSAAFFMNFDTLHEPAETQPDPWMPQTESLQVEVIHKPDRSLFRQNRHKLKGRRIHKPIHSF